MDHPRTKAVLELGIADPNTLQQLQDWGYLPEMKLDTPPQTGDEAVSRVREAIEGHDAVEMRDTDLDIVQQFMADQREGKLYLPSPDRSKAVPVTVAYCVTRMGEYVIPWRSEPITDLLLDPMTYLKPKGEPRIHFSNTRELFFGGEKVFVVCEPQEAQDGSQR